MKTILCTGDSHTWGQGAVGYADGFTSPLMGGDLRPAGWHTGAYVNCLRRTFGGPAQVWDTAACAAAFHTACGEQGALLSSEYTLHTDMRLVRLFFYQDASAVVTLLSGQNRCEVTLRDIGHPNAWREVSLFMQDNTLTVSVQGRATLYRAEWYGGDVAVINSGVGSTTCGCYTTHYVDEKVVPFTPYAVLAEAHTVNNWLTGQTPGAYRDELCAYLARLLTLTPRVALLTAAPVLGQTANAAGFEYADYTAASREAAAQTAVTLVDAALLFDTAAPQFDDIWHPNDAGHALYARAAMPVLQAWLD